ncbi:hypothetical protein HELRODRAFT_75040 [Helobdella robusta]|uniref:Junctophilin n=1 Tax=Helobdella robusta TaxID=6412 RepID=T1G1Z7_HELRO|nr:hypothetical protein HELRODRAFT_75040 [Helobdella robusta]ESO08331.1 hypothetical protein HELRODRAFT_75040 [Helobdella robusta]
MEQPFNGTALSQNFEELKFEDGGVYYGGTNGGKAHGYGICTGPGGEGQYSGAWSGGFEVNGSYSWPNGNAYHGQWLQGKRHGLGMEKRNHWIYQGELTNGLFGKYGVKKHQFTDARYEGTWSSGVQCGYGVETYADKGTYVGQWQKGARHGYGIRTSSTFKLAATSPQSYALSRKFSLTSARIPPPHIYEKISHTKLLPVNRIGFFLKGKYNDQEPEALKTSDQTKFVDKTLKGNIEYLQQNNSGSAVLSDEQSTSKNINKMSLTANSSNLLCLNSVPEEACEIYSGEWKNDKRNGFGVCHRSDGLKYEGEWSDNCKNGHGVTTFSDGSKEEGLYKNNVLTEAMKRLNVLKLGKTKELIDAAASSANKAAQIASQKAQIAISR